MSDDPTSYHAPSRGDKVIDSIVDEFVEQALSGNVPDIEGACARYPEFADRIRKAAASLRLLVDQHSNLAGGINSQSLRSEITSELEGTSQYSLDPALEVATEKLPYGLVDFGGKFRLCEELGQGRFGVVFVAEQLEPVRRKVAIKVVKPGMDSKEVLARFEAERQALAIMDHPNVAKVLDGGMTKDGRPYFVMELIRGISITRFCNMQKYGLDQRLELFRDVCLAVQHAHLKGIIHRDIKPSNVLVTMRDDTPIVKVIDFGVAKALHGQLSEQTIYTAFGQMIGTPLYMSPEQIQLNELDVDTRSDIYSLGVLLYELITSETPFTKESLVENGIQAFREMVCDSAPPRPSHRINTLQASEDPTVVDKRRYDGRELKRLSGELDWIVMKSLEKDRQRRYQSASDFAEDIGCLLSGDEVKAKPPTLLYRVSKTIKRNKPVFATLGAVVIALLIGMITTYSQMKRAEGAEQEALEALSEVEKQRELAEQRLEFAEQAVDDTYTQFAQKWISQEQGLSLVQREFLQKALDIYRHLADSSNGPRSDESVVKALRRVATINSSLGNDSDALNAQKEVVALTKAQSLAEPGNSKIQLRYVTDCISLSKMFRALGDSSQGAKHIDQAVSTFKAIDFKTLNDQSQRRLFGSNAAYLARELVQDVATLEQSGQLAIIAVNAADQLRSESPENVQIKRLAATAYSTQAYFFLRIGEFIRATEKFDKAIVFFDELIASTEASKEDLYNFAGTLSNKGGALRSIDAEQSLDEILKRILEIEREAVKRFPDDVSSYERLADGLNKATLYAIDHGQLERALDLSVEAQQIAEDLVDRFPQRTSSWTQLVSSERHLADIELKLDNLEAAAKYYREMYQTAALAGQRHPRESIFYQDKAIALALEGQLWLRKADFSRLRDVIVLFDTCFVQEIETPKDVDIRSIAVFNDILNYFTVFEDLLSSAIFELDDSNEADTKLISEFRLMQSGLADKFQDRIEDWARYVADLPDQGTLFQDPSFMATPPPAFFFLTPPRPGFAEFPTARSRMRSVEGLIAYLLRHRTPWNYWPELLFVATSFQWTADNEILVQASKLLDDQAPKHQQAYAWCLFRLGKYNECSEILDQKEFKSEENCFIRAMVAWELKDRKKARAQLAIGNAWMEKNESSLHDRNAGGLLQNVPHVGILERLAYEANDRIKPTWESWLDIILSD